MSHQLPSKADWRGLCHQLAALPGIPEHLRSRFEKLEGQELSPRFQEDVLHLPLTQGLWALVDAEDAQKVLQHSWYAVESSGLYYARAKISGKATPLHRFILGETDSSILVDHINGNTLDNRRENLRRVNRYQSAQNRRFQRKGYKGVYERKTSKGISRFRAIIVANGVRKNIGTFDTAEEAAAAYNKSALELHGAYASLNSVDI